MGSVQLVHGDIFSGPSDLIVLPCDTGGGVTEFVGERLTTFNIPYPKPMALGSVQIAPFSGAENIAHFVAFAASVRGRGETEPAAIEQIGKSLGKATRTLPALQAVSAPLLGAGAGGLQSEIVVERLRTGFLAESSQEAALKIFVLRDSLYTRLVNHFKASLWELQRQAGSQLPGEQPATTLPLPDPAQQRVGTHLRTEPIRVFISYTAVSPEDRDWVKELATFLRQNGVNARCDIWHLQLGTNVTQWMCNELELASRVLLICNEAYAQRADRLHGGVGWEIMLVQGDINFHRETSKYIPLVRSDDAEKGLPAFLKGFYCLHWPPSGDETALRSTLLKAIYRVHEEEPPIGAAPATFI